MLPPEQVLPQQREMCSAGRKKHTPCPAAKRDLVSFALLLLLCSAPCTYLSRSALAGGFWDCQAASSPAQHLLKCLPEHILSAYLSRKRSIFGNGVPSWGGQCSISASGQTDAVQGQKGKLGSLHLFSLSQSGNEGSRKLPLSYRKVKYLGACSSTIKTTLRCRWL